MEVGPTVFTLIREVSGIVRSLVRALAPVAFPTVLHLPEVRAPSLSARVLLQAFFLGAPVLKPNLRTTQIKHRIRSLARNMEGCNGLVVWSYEMGWW